MQLVDELRCTSTEAERVGRVTVLPILLSGVLPYGQLDGKILEDLLLGLMQGSKKEDNDAVESIWAVQHLEVSFWGRVLLMHALLCDTKAASQCSHEMYMIMVGEPACQLDALLCPGMLCKFRLCVVKSC